MTPTVPWWKKAAMAGAGAMNGYAGAKRPGGIDGSSYSRPDPYRAMGQAAGQAGSRFARPKVSGGPPMTGLQMQGAMGATPTTPAGASGPPPAPMPPASPAPPPIQQQQQQNSISSMAGGVGGAPGAPPSPASGGIDQPPSTPPMSGNPPQSMAAGKVVTKPTVALLGEKGPEAVVPMGGRPDARVRASAVFGRRPYGS